MQYLTILIVFICLTLLACDSTVEKATDINLEITWNLETNHPEGGHRATWTIHNNSNITLTPDNWKLYWNMAPRGIKAESITAAVTMRWINGDFYEMVPTANFELKKGDSISISYEGTEYMIKESDGPLGVYSLYTDADGIEQTILVQNMTILPFDSPNQITRDKTDKEPIPTAQWLYANNASITEISAEEMELVVPTPMKTTRKGGEVTITSATVIHFQEGLEKQAELLAEQLGLHLSENLTTQLSDVAGKDIILLKREDRSVEGAYTLDVSTAGVIISGNPSGVFYASQSLVALLPVDILGQKNESISISTVVIEDRPAFGYRGMFVDVTRNFNSVATLKKLIDIMAFYKLNKFHIHLSEDEAWRIEIEELPELTQLGAFRGHTTNDEKNLQPSYGSGPSTDLKAGYGSGFYTRDEFKSLLKYAFDRHIQVIPEINVPGHSRAAIKAMEYRYRNLMEQGKKKEANEFRLIDPDDASEYKSAQWYTDNVISVCRESAFRFFTTVVDDIFEMYLEAGVPFELFHTGGDEVPKGAWTGSPLCQEYLKQHPEVDNPKNLQKVFFNRIQAYLASKGLQAGGWEEIVQNFAEDGSWTVNNEFANSTVVPYIWNSLWGTEDLSNKVANAGYPTVLNSVTNFYFDLAYNKDPREPGLYWAGFVDTKDAYIFAPYDVFNSIKVDSFGHEYADADFKGLEKLNKVGRANILGFQAQLWSETVKGQEMLEYYILPKLLGLAERAWHGQATWSEIEGRAARETATNQAWNAFANLLGRKEFPRMDKIFGGYNYRLASPGAKLKNGRLLANTAYPGMQIRYTTDGSEPTSESPVYNQPIKMGKQKFKFSTFDTRGRASLPTVLDLQQQ